MARRRRHYKRRAPTEPLPVTSRCQSYARPSGGRAPATLRRAPRRVWCRGPRPGSAARDSRAPVEIGIVMDANLPLVLVKAMQAPDVLGNGAAPRDGHGQEQGVEAGIVEPLPDEATRCQQYLAGHVLGGLCQSGLERLGAHAAPEHDHACPDGTKPAGKGLQVIDPFGQNEGRATRSNALVHIGADRCIASIVLRQVLANALILDARVAVGLAGHAKTGRANQHLVGEGPAGRLPPGVHAMPDGSALHEQGRVLAVLPRHGGRQPSDVARLGSVGHLRETRRRDVVAFVHHYVAVVRDAVVHLPVPDQALNHGDVDPAPELPAASAETADLRFRDVEKLTQPVGPLLHELLAVNENQGVDAALGDQPGGDHRLSECGRRGQNAGVVLEHGGGRHLLFGAKLALEGHRNRCPGVTLIIDRRRDAEAPQQVSGIVQTPPRKPDELRAILHAVDDSRGSVGGEAHGLRAVELGILKRRQAHQPGDDAGREVLLRDVDSVAEHDLDGFGKGSGHRAGRGAGATAAPSTARRQADRRSRPPSRPARAHPSPPRARAILPCSPARGRAATGTPTGR